MDAMEFIQNLVEILPSVDDMGNWQIIAQMKKNLQKLFVEVDNPNFTNKLVASNSRKWLHVH